MLLLCSFHRDLNIPFNVEKVKPLPFNGNGFNGNGLTFTNGNSLTGLTLFGLGESPGGGVDRRPVPWPRPGVQPHSLRGMTPC
jgi:hypothetical protein